MLQVHNPFDGWQPPPAQELEAINREAAEAVLEEILARLETDASGDPEWEEFATLARSHASEGRLYAGLDPEDGANQRFFDLEYGTQERSPTGFLRMFIERHRFDLERQYGEAVIDRIMGAI